MIIKAILHITNSAADFAGNCHYAFEYTNLANDKTARGRISGGESNIRGAMHHVKLCQENYESAHAVQIWVNEIPIRRWNRMTEGWEYAGCTPEEIAAFCKKYTN